MARRQPLWRRRVNDLRVAVERIARDRRDAAARLDANQSIERGRRRLIGPRARLIEPPCFDQRRQGQPLPATHVRKRPFPTAGCR